MGIRRGILIVLIILLLLIISTGVISLLSFINEDLTFTISPAHKSIILYQGEETNLTFSIKPKFSGVCFSICETEFIDLSKGTVLSEGNLTIYPFETKNMTQNISAPGLGIGQKSYNLDIKCRSLKTPLCITQGAWTERTAYITLNYQFNPEKGQIQEMAKNNLTTALLSLNKTDYNIQETSDILNQTTNRIVIETRLSNQIVLNIINFNSLKNQAIALKKIWYEQEGYNLILEKLTEDFFNSLFSLENYSEKGKQELYDSINHHNQLVDLFNSEEQILNILDFSNIAKDEKINFVKTYERFKDLNFTSYDEINTIIMISKENLESAFSGYQQKSKSSLSSNKNLRCMLKGYCQFQSSEIDTDSMNYTEICSLIGKENENMQNADNSFAYNYAIQNNLNISGLTGENAYNLLYNYLDIQTYLNNKQFSGEVQILYSNSLNNATNIEIRKQNEEIIKLNENISNLNKIISVLNPMIIQNGSEDIGFCNGLISVYNYEKDSLKRKILADKIISGCYSKLDGMLNGTSGEYNQTLSRISNLTEIDENKIIDFSPNFNIDLEIMAINLSQTNNSILNEFEKKICGMPINYTSISINSSKVFLAPFDSFNQTIETSLEKPQPICCILGNCSLCCINESCANDPKTFPIIFLHGHPFNEAYSPDYSLDIFNPLQDKLTNEGYIKAGIVTSTSSYSDIPKGDWGFSGMPVIIKASYYYNVSNVTGEALSDVTQSNENITVYADRLKGIIDLIKYRSGRNKVNIIAHSMGGLVAREYIRKYGEDNINKLIMVGTPNYGIFGDVNSYCPVLGARTECLEMGQNSSFLERLNTYSPKNKTEFYTIIGTGCDMGEDLDGDGIVSENNVALSYSKNYYINGSCSSLFSPLHVQMLDLNKYPETYGMIKDALKASD